MQELSLQIFDETLRDGEQQAGLFLAPDLKRELAVRIARTGVHQIDVMPYVDESEARLAGDLVADGLGEVVTAATMVGLPYVAQARRCGVRRIILFYAVSDRLLFLRDPELRGDPVWRGKTLDDGVPEPVLKGARDRMLGAVLESVREAAGGAPALRVDFAAEDASRADPAFLRRCLAEIGPHVGHFMLCDTVGVLDPEETLRWIGALQRDVPDVPLAVHFHNDRGLALQNTLAAVRSGVSQVSGTFGGIGERAGNVALDQVLFALRHQDGVRVDGIDYDAVRELVSFMEERSLRAASPYSPEAQRHESGIHVHSLLHDPQSYCPFPEATPEVWFGRFSGASNFQYLFERVLDRPQPRDRYTQWAAALKRLCLAEQRCYSGQEVLALIERGVLASEET